MKKIFINAIHPEEIRVVTTLSGSVQNLDIETRSYLHTKSNIYLGVVKRVVASLEAVFVEYGAVKQGFLPIKEISSKYLTKDEQGNPKVKEGQKLIVQVVKEDRWNKGAALTTFVSIAGKCLVIMPDNPTVNGVSKRLKSNERDEIRAKLEELNTPEDMGVIVRTAGFSSSLKELQHDLDYLLSLWNSIVNQSNKLSHPTLLFKESALIIRVLRDYLQRDVEEVLIDDENVFNESLEFVKQVIPAYKDIIKLYVGKTPMFSYYKLESQIKTAFQREVYLPSGGSIVLDPTEALLSIDINSSKSTSGQNINETALSTNLEAADEIAKQIRLRDIGGLIVVDFIDMYNDEDKQKVEQRMKQALNLDNVRVQTSQLSEFGLMEISRQRLKPSLNEISGVLCTLCNGQGRIRDTESFALMIVRLIEEAVQVPTAAQVQVKIPANIATYILNGKRSYLLKLENHYNVETIVVPNFNMKIPEYEVTCIKQDGNTVKLSDGEPLNTPANKRINVDSKHKYAISWCQYKKQSGSKRTIYASLFKILWPFSKKKQAPANRNRKVKNNYKNNKQRNNYRRPARKTERRT